MKLNIIGTDEACKILKISKTTLNTILATDKTFPAVQTNKGCKWMINADLLEKWLMSKKINKQNKNLENNNLGKINSIGG